MFINVTFPVRTLITATFIFLPFVIQIKGIIPGGTIPLIDILMLLIIFISIFGKLSFGLKDSLPAIFMSLYCLMVLVSGIFSKDESGYLELFSQYFLSYVLFYLVLINYKFIFDENLTKIFLFSSSISVFFIAIYYHLDIRFFQHILSYNATGGSIFKRVGFTAVNDYGYILAASILSHINIAKKVSIFDIFLIFLIIYGILLTGSRSAMLFLLCGFSIFFFTSNKIRFINKIIVILFILFIVSSIFYLLQFLIIDNRIFQNFELASRLSFVDSLTSSNISLIGSEANFKYDGVPIHINLIQILLSSGILALIFYLLWYFSIILRSYSQKDFSLIFFMLLIFLFYQQIGHIYERNLFLVFAIIFLTGLNKRSLN